MFSEISLAYWIMDDGYFDSHGRTKTILISKTSLDRVISLVKPYMHVDFLYKLGI